MLARRALHDMTLRRIFIAELLILVGPVGILATGGPLYVLGRWGYPDALPILVVWIVGTIGLVGLVALSVRFLESGVAGVVGAKKWMWAAAATGALCAIAGTTSVLLGGDDVIGWGAIGLPAVLPFLHLLTYKVIGERANP